MARHLEDIAYRIRLAAAPVCHVVSPTIGGQWTNPTQFATALRPTATAFLHLRGDFPVMAIVAAGSPADRAGLRLGDAVAAIDEKPLEPGAWAADEAISLAAFRDFGHHTMKVIRGAETLTVSMRVERSCTAPMVLADDGPPTSFTDGHKVFLNGALMRLASTDGMLAFLVGHEVSHIARDDNAATREADRASKVAENVAGAIGTALAAAVHNPALRDNEFAADELGLKISSAAGYDPADGAKMIRAMDAVAHGAVMADHPAWTERAARLENEAAEIVKRRSAGLPILP